MATEATSDDEPTTTETLRARLDAGDVTADDVVARLVDAGPEDARTILPKAQAEALVYRDLLGRSRQDTADALDVSVYTVDDRLSRARANRDALAAVARLLRDLDVLDGEDLGDDTATLDAFEAAEETETDESDDDEPETPVFEVVGVDDTDAADSWGRLMARDGVKQVTRGSPGGITSVKLDPATDDVVEAVKADLAALGLVPFGVEEYGGDVSTVRARVPEEPAEEISEEPATDDAVEHVEEDVDEPEPEESDDVEHVEETETDDESAEDAETFTCEDCGRTFDTAGGLGGHRRYCEERRERAEAAEADVEDLPGIGPSKGEDLRARGFSTVEDVAEAEVVDLKNPPKVGASAASTARDAARERLGLVDPADPSETAE